MMVIFTAWRLVTVGILSALAAGVFGTATASASVSSPIGVGYGSTVLVCDASRHTILMTPTIYADGTTGSALGEYLPQDVWLTVEYYYRSNQNASWSQRYLLFDQQATTLHTNWTQTLNTNPAATGQYWVNAYYYWHQYNRTWSNAVYEHVVAKQVIDYSHPNSPSDICTV